MFLPCGGECNARQEVLENLEINPDSLVLETGIGIGDNISYLNGILNGRPYYGLDNQNIMLHKCIMNSNKWKQPVKLYRANAEELPFKDNSFDVVFHLGAINLFRDKKSAIDEMIRVAKPGTRIVIADESEKASRLFAIFVGHHDPVVPPVDLIPGTMLEINLKSIWKDYGYLITFRKPGRFILNV
jgi:ubiquinone/menaquinone biosynthesis C-methylase UbiE